MGEQVKQPEIRYGYTNALSMDQTDADGTRYPWRIAIADDVDAALASARAEVVRLRERERVLTEALQSMVDGARALGVMADWDTMRTARAALAPELK